MNRPQAFAISFGSFQQLSHEVRWKDTGFSSPSSIADSISLRSVGDSPSPRALSVGVSSHIASIVYHSALRTSTERAVETGVAEKRVVENGEKEKRKLDDESVQREGKEDRIGEGEAEDEDDNEANALEDETDNSDGLQEAGLACAFTEFREWRRNLTKIIYSNEISDSQKSELVRRERERPDRPRVFRTGKSVCCLLWACEPAMRRTLERLKFTIVESDEVTGESFSECSQTTVIWSLPSTVRALMVP